MLQDLLNTRELIHLLPTDSPETCQTFSEKLTAQLKTLSLPALFQAAEAQIAQEHRRYGWGRKTLNLTPYGHFHPSEFITNCVANAARGRLWKTPNPKISPEDMYVYDFDANGNPLRIIQGQRFKQTTVFMYDEPFCSAVTVDSEGEIALAMLLESSTDGLFPRMALAGFCGRQSRLECLKIETETYEPIQNHQRKGRRIQAFSENDRFEIIPPFDFTLTYDNQTKKSEHPPTLF